MVDTAGYVLKIAHGIYLELKAMREEIVANKNAYDLLLSRIENVMPDVEEMVKVGLSDDSKLQPARNFLKLFEDVRDWARQFCMRGDSGKGFIERAVAWTRKAYNRKEDRNALQEFLQRLDTCSRDLNLRITMDVQKSVSELKQDAENMARLLQEDGDAMRISIENLKKKIDFHRDEEAQKHEEQFHTLQNALEELSKQRLDGSLSSSSSSAGSSSEGSNSVGESWCAMLPSVKQLYEYVHADHPHDPVSDRDDSSLGEGAFGEVFLAKGKIVVEELVAIKMLKLKKVKNAGVSTDTMRQEAANLRRLNHINVVRMFGEVQEEDGKLYGIVMEYAPGGSVQGRIKDAAGKGLPQARQWLLELGQGLCHMHHECRMQHRDLKPQNLLLDGQDRLKISDLGLACAYQTVQSLSKQGTQLYMSPEKGSGKRYGTMDDMWAVGCILLELLRGEGMGALCPAGLGSHAPGNAGFTEGLVAPLKEEKSCFAGAVDLVLRLLQVL